MTTGLKYHDRILNKYIAGRTHVEYCKEYYKTNKIKILKDTKEYYETNKIKMAECRKKRYDINKIKLLEKNICECGGKYVSQHKLTHNKSQRHKLYIETNQI